MGYYTKFDLTWDNRDVTDAAVGAKLEAINHGYFSGGSEVKTIDSLFWEEMKWYDHKKDMIELSKNFPDTVFELNGFGEEWDDFWIEYYKNGLYQHCRGNIVYEPFDENNFEEVD